MDPGPCRASGAAAADRCGYRSSDEPSRLAIRLVVLGAVLVAVTDGEDLADAASIGGLDGQGETVDLDLVAGLRHAADPVIDQPADRVVFIGVLETEVRVEQLGEIVDVRASVDPRLIVGETHDERLLLVVLVLDLADDLLEQVLDGDEARRPAVFVE